MDKFDKYFLKNSISYEGKTSVVTGATGSLGFYISRYLLLAGSKLILVGRNIKKIEKTKADLLKEFPNASIDHLVCDFSSLEDTNRLIDELLKIKIDYLFNNAGVYHLPVKKVGNYDITFVTNFISPYLISEKISRNCRDIKIIQTASISYKFTKINKNDIEMLNCKNKTKRYGSSKRFFIISTLLLQKSLQNSIILAHPGISTTSLFNSEKGGFGKLFNKLIVPIMKIVFMKPKKAALPMALAASFKNTDNSLVGPRGFLNSWGYPKVSKIRKNDIKQYEFDIVNDLIKNIN